MRVFVYFNLHRKCWSIKALEGERKGRVIGHAKYIDLSNVVWKVSEAGRQRVLREGRKNDHAGAVGYLQNWLDIHNVKHVVHKGETLHDLYLKTPTPADMVTYNSRKAPTFTDVDTGEPVKHSHTAFLCPDCRVYVYGRSA